MKLAVRVSTLLALMAGGTLMCAVAAPPSKPIRLMEINELDGTNLYWEATAEELRSWPRWDPAKEPPLTLPAAVETAFQALPPGEKREDWQLNMISLQQPMADEARSSLGPVFFYVVTLSRRTDSWSTWDSLINLRGDVIPSRTEKLPGESVRTCSGETTITIVPKRTSPPAK